jgi:hypothetical protein
LLGVEETCGFEGRDERIWECYVLVRDPESVEEGLESFLVGRLGEVGFYVAEGALWLHISSTK